MTKKTTKRNSWASAAIETLQAGNAAVINPKGNSMQPKVKSGATVTVSPLEDDEPNPGDVVLVKVGGRVYLHLVKAVRGRGSDEQYQIANNKGRINGWVSRSAVYGIATHIDNRNRKK